MATSTAILLWVCSLLEHQNILAESVPLDVMTLQVEATSASKVVVFVVRSLRPRNLYSTQMRETLVHVRYLIDGSEVNMVG